MEREEKESNFTVEIPDNYSPSQVIKVCKSSNTVQNKVAPVKGHCNTLSDTKELENYLRQEYTDSQENHIL